MLRKINRLINRINTVQYRNFILGFLPPQQGNLIQWFDGLSFTVGNFDGNDEILLNSVPDCFSQANCVITGEYHLEVGATSYLCNAANSSNPNVLCGAILSAGGQIQFLTRGVSNVLNSVTFGAWDGQGEPKFVINGTSIDCFVDGVQLGTTQTIVDITDNVEFPFDRFYIGSRGNVDQPIKGLHWNFSIGEAGQTPLVIPINDGSGTDIKDSTGVSVGTLTDASPATFWLYNYLKDLSNNGNYGLLNNTTGGIIPIPTGIPDEVEIVLNTGLVAGTEYTRLQLSTEPPHNPDVVFTSPEVLESIIGDLYRQLVYPTGNDFGDPTETVKASRYVGRDSQLFFSIDSNGDDAIDVNLDDAIAEV